VDVCEEAGLLELRRDLAQRYASLARAHLQAASRDVGCLDPRHLAGGVHAKQPRNPGVIMQQESAAIGALAPALPTTSTAQERSRP
jgi:hypothetical protein